MNKHYIALLRHGEYHQQVHVPSALQPYPLTNRGEAQALKAAQCIQEFAQMHNLAIHQTIDCSPLLRSWQTADIIAKKIDSETMRVESFDALIERSVGSVANLTIAEIEQVISADPRFDKPPLDWKSNSTYRLPFYGAESLMQAGERVQQHIQRAINNLVFECRIPSVKLMVGHGASLRHAAHLMGIIEFDEIAKLSMHHARPIIFEINAMGLKHVSGEWKTRDSAVFNNSLTLPSDFSD
ncbi:MAG TPA: histidine phosphatase family protein [Marinagarivorans sp.]